MNRSAALAVMLAAFGLFVLELLFRAEVWQWHWHWLPRALRTVIGNGIAETVTLVIGLGAAFFWLRPSYR
jgi:hypothetical protein